jgi:hypothetical protein
MSESTERPPSPIHGFAASVVVLDTYRGPGSHSVKGAGLHIALEAQGRPGVRVIATLSPDRLRKLAADLEAIIGRQDRD